VKLLIAEDDAFFRRLLAKVLAPDYEIVATQDGGEAWQALHLPDAPRLAILDWVMPGLTGPQICRQVRSSPELCSAYLIILTAKNSVADVVSGLRAGADDYVTKPFDPEELRARVKVGERVLSLQAALSAQFAALEDALAREKQLQALLPICPSCRRIRADGEYWHQVDLYIHAQGRAEVSPHGICPSCFDKVVTPDFQLTAGSPGPSRK
jgi:DNA-binding response OmpR family regulator